jgi:solute carrier family 25 protein 34/35
MQLDGEGGRARQYRGIGHAFASVARQEGLAGLQKGLAPALGYQVAMNGCRLGLYDSFQRAIRDATHLPADSTLLRAAAAALSGAVGATLGSPLFLVKSRLQAQSAHFAAAERHAYAGAWDGLRQIAAKEGVRGLFRGVDGALPRVMVGSATQLASYDKCKDVSAAAGLPPGVAQHVCASIISSLLTVTAMNPFDVVSTRLYQSAGVGTHYSGPLDCMVQTVRREGGRALMKGWAAQYTRLGPQTVITFLVLERLKPAFLAIDAFTEGGEGRGRENTKGGPAGAAGGGGGSGGGGRVGGGGVPVARPGLGDAAVTATEAVE